MRSTRRRLLVTAGTNLAAIGILRASSRAAQFEYRLAHPDPVEQPLHVRMVQMALAVQAETNGRLRITIFPNNTLGSQSSVLTQLRQGAIQLLANLSAVYSSVVPVAAIDSVGFAFSSPRDPVVVMDGPLGVYVRKEFAARGLYAFEKAWDQGMKQVTSSGKPVRSVADFANFKIRTPPAKIAVDLWTTLGASPTPLDSNESYTSMQTHLVDGSESTLSNIETARYYEVQKYLSMTNHAWAGFWFAANADAWNALPPDIRAVLDRNAAKYALLARNDTVVSTGATADKLRRQGMLFNAPDVASMRARLRPYYMRWKNELGNTAWDLLEAKVGKLA
jgi:TRAP-type transport system periplasmic protein